MSVHGGIDSARVSVVIPVHNGAQLLGPTLASITSQSARPGEVIVVDDGSTDASAAVAAAFGATVISQAQSGPAAARNTGTRAASGEFIAYLDGDDLWHEDKLAEQLAALGAASEPAFSFTDFVMFDERGAIGGHQGLARHPVFRRTRKRRESAHVLAIAAGARPVLRDNYILPSSALVRREDALAIGGFDETLPYGIEDYEFFLRLFRRVPALVVMKPLLLYRRHGAQLSSGSVAMKAGFFEIQRRVANAPERYPDADAAYITRSTPYQHRRLGYAYLRRGEFAAAIASFEQSLASGPTLAANVGLRGARFAASPLGSTSFRVARGVWRLRPGRRSAP